jgi:hypothetical protein
MIYFFKEFSLNLVKKVNEILVRIGSPELFIKITLNSDTDAIEQHAVSSPEQQQQQTASSSIQVVEQETTKLVESQANTRYSGDQSPVFGINRSSQDIKSQDASANVEDKVASGKNRADNEVNTDEASLSDVSDSQIKTKEPQAKTQSETESNELGEQRETSSQHQNEERPAANDPLKRDDVSSIDSDEKKFHEIRLNENNQEEEGEEAITDGETELDEEQETYMSEERSTLKVPQIVIESCTESNVSIDRSDISLDQIVRQQL